MSTNAFSMFFTPGGLPSPAGPQELADALIFGREHSGFTPSHLTNDEVLRLTQEAFRASLWPEEGRFPKFQLAAYWSPEARGAFRLANFADPVPVSADKIRRLAPALSNVSHALVVRSTDRQLMLTGIDSTERWGLISPAEGRSSGPPLAGTAGLRLRVDGPGELFASEAAVRLRLRAGTMSELVPVGSHRTWQPWRRTAANAIVEDLRGRGVPDLEHLFGGVFPIETMVGGLLTQVLERVTAARHGGTVVIVPPAGYDRLHFRWKLTDLSPCKAAADWWQASKEASDTVSETSIRRQHLAGERLFHMMRSLADLTRADGCLVLSPELEAVGFGAEIRVSDDDAWRSTVIFSDLVTGNAWPDQAGTDLGGTRHRSAYRLCKVVPNSLAFVVSQDGDLTMILSTDEKVHAIRGLIADQRF